MNVFLIGWSPAGGVEQDVASRAMLEADALHEKLGRGELVTWRSPDTCLVVASLQHSPQQVPAVRYLDVSTEWMTLFAGMPFLWKDEHETDGVGPLDAAFFRTRDLSKCELDGRYTVARYGISTGVLEILTDRLGSYPVFTAENGNTTWFGNAPFVVSRASGRTELNPEPIGHFLTIGWSLGGAPIWRGVNRVPRATLAARSRDGSVSTTDLFPATALRGLFGGQPDMRRAAGILTATVAAQGAWPGRPNVVPISGGRDSRVVLAAAVAADIEFTSRTIAFPRAAGFPETDDVQISAEVMAALGGERSVVQPEEEGGLRWSASLVRQTTHGLMSLLETGLVSRGGHSERLEVIHSGAGGELSRGLLFAGERPTERELTDRIFRNWAHGYPPLVTRDEVIAATRSFIAAFVAQHRELGFESDDIPDAFWLLERMQNWVAPPQHLQELSNDTTAPLWSPRMLPFTLAGTVRDRRGEPLHYAILESLAPSLARIRFDGVNPAWPAFGSRGSRVRRQRALVVKVRRELRRRSAARRAQGAGVTDPLLVQAHTEVKDAALTLTDHVAWEVLDRARTLRLLRRDLYKLDPRSQAMLWRLATVFAADRTP